MDLSFANPAGFWALLGIPAVLAIHFLQRRSRVVEVTTLFLLEQMRRESETGHRFQRLRSSIPLWLQLLMVLLLTWLLSGPRWLRTESLQRVAVVLDASASMQVSREKALAALGSELDRLSAAARQSELTVMTSEPEAPALYHGMDRIEAVEAAHRWHPQLGSHDPAGAFRIARGLVGDGTIVFLTDDVPAAASPFDVQILAVGEPDENCGFAGSSIEAADGKVVFKALVKNFGRLPQHRRWWIESAGRRSEPATLEIAAGQTLTLQGAFPAEVQACTIRIESDRLSIDDLLPMVRPENKSLAAFIAPASDGTAALQEIFDSFPQIKSSPAAESADLVAVTYDPLVPSLPDRHACVFAADPQPGASYLAGAVLAEPHSLIDGLNWQSLLVRDSLGIPRGKDDRVLLWQGERPLIMLRAVAGKYQLLCNFDLRTSNARKLPAFAVLLHRFLDHLRHTKIGFEAANFETNQALGLAHDTSVGAAALTISITPPDQASSSESIEVPATQAAILRAPPMPSLFTVTQGDATLLRAAARFGDPRESDLTRLASKNELDERRAVLVERHSEADSHWRWWVAVVLAALLASWWFSREARPVRATPEVA